MKTLAKYHICNHCVIGEKTFKNILIGPGKLPGLSRNGSLVPRALDPLDPKKLAKMVTKISSITPGGGGTQESLYGEALTGGPNPLTLLYVIFDRKGNPFIYLP